ncbi:MAG: nickel-dependent hydrogenase large subunit [Candidatus Thiodiazotropha sp.]
MSIEGKLRIELLCRDNRVRRVRILSSRPLQLPLLFEGKPVQEVLQTIPMLYSICATAQASAAVTACRQAVGVEAEPRVLMAESMLVWFETAREHLWRALIDWPGYLGEEVDRLQLPGLSSMVADAKRALFDDNASAFSLEPVVRPDPDALGQLISRFSQIMERTVFGTPAEEWYALASAQALEHWIQAKQTAAARYLYKLTTAGMAQLGQTCIEALPDFDTELLHERLQQPDADAFIAAPEWQAGPCETSALTRLRDHPLIVALQPVYGKGLLTRLVARLLELASIPDHLTHLLQRAASPETTRTAQRPVASGRGLGMVEAARGRLVHRASVSGDTIARYQILAPTEWNFHPRGLVAEGLLGLVCGYEAQMREQASLFISAVDPCVGYSFEFV